MTQLPQFKGKVAQYDLTPRGDVDGLILDDGTEIHFPPHLDMEIVAAVRPGETVTVHGLKAKALSLIQAMSVTGDASGKTVVDNGPQGPGGRPGPRPPQSGQPIQGQGPVKMQLHGPRGELNGVLLQDGTIIHMPPPEASRLARQLAVGQTIFVRGDGMESSLGRVIDAREIGASADQMALIKAPPPPPGGPRGPGEPGGPGARRADNTPPPPGSPSAQQPDAARPSPAGAAAPATPQ